MTSIQEQAHHGDVTLQVDVHDGLVEYVLVIDHTLPLDAGRVRISEQQARDLRLCCADIFPYTEEHEAHPARTVVGSEILGYDNGVPVRELHLPEKPCGCGVLLGEVCDCYPPAGRSVW